MSDEKQKVIQDAQHKINQGRYKDACRDLRYLFEVYLKGLCNGDDNGCSLFEIINRLYQENKINHLEQLKFHLWRKYGNTGAHPNTINIQKEDAESFLNGISGYLNISLEPSLPDLPTQPNPQRIKNRKLNKNDAIKIIYEKSGETISKNDCVFSNINKSKPVWWFDPSFNKFENTFFIVLNDHIERKLYLFEIPINSFPDPNIYFKEIDGRNAVSIEIRKNDTQNFEDVKSGSPARIKFRRYFTKEISYI